MAIDSYDTISYLLIDELDDLIIEQQPATARLHHRHVVPLVEPAPDVHHYSKQSNHVSKFTTERNTGK